MNLDEKICNTCQHSHDRTPELISCTWWETFVERTKKDQNCWEKARPYRGIIARQECQGHYEKEKTWRDLGLI